ncbi:flavin-containing monooxygenase FMO GS-OX-like 4 [Megalops cyprinoides]|uniref:flavin-containing monooxygenase FMO GS-OX-like 4 n=1 Tax=Megalops cyprinoides TaxID=118141 RepID=UPI0018654C32|nr:flavin-containing monooxygenase FMO GS-OX-like 4 [Megalops cyprinoides]
MTAATLLLPWMSHMRKLRVAVVGAGAAGLCAARHILSRQDTFAPPVVYEQTKQLGGTWVYEEHVGSYDNGLPIHSSMYRNLRTNLPKEVMMFPDFPFDPQLPSFLPHQEVLRYLERYCQSHNITPHIRFETVVEEVKPISPETEAGKVTWEVTSSSGQQGQTTEKFDGIFVCNGHFSDPHWPSIPGLEYFKGMLLHSHSYRHPEPFEGQSVVILGAGASGIDISIELASVNAQVILSHSKPPLSFPLPPEIKQVPPVVQVLEDGTLQFQDGGLARPQVLLLCTGYNFSYPFLNAAELGLRVRDQLIYPLYKFLLPPAFPSLFIVGVCKVICPFPHFHCQVQFALAVLDGSLALPSREEMEEEAKREMERKTGEGVEARHLLKMDSDQWGYYRTLASMGGFSPLPPVTQSLYEEVKRQRERHPLRYRQLNYQLVSDTQWEILELHPESEREGGKGR